MKLAPSHVPHPVVILAIDPGRVSGWALYVHGQRLDSGIANTVETRRAAVELAQAAERDSGYRLVVVGETWQASRHAGKDRRMNAATLAGLGASWGLWLAALEEAEHPKRRVMRCPQTAWKRAIVGSPFASHAVSMVALARRYGDRPEDELAALAIGEWATRAGEVAAKIPKRRAA